MWNEIAQAISENSSQPFVVHERQSIGGGCISSAWRLRGEDGREFFVKTHERRHAEMFAAEAAGLNEIASF